jgi:hypothetical protein
MAFKTSKLRTKLKNSTPYWTLNSPKPFGLSGG